ncbi:hypothetical protein [Saccharopolyspora tripterygii]
MTTRYDQPKVVTTMANPASSPASPQNVANTQRRERALQLRLSGATFQQIADELGYTDKTAAYKSIRHALDRIGREEAQELFDLDLARLDRLLMAVWPQAMKGDLFAVDRALKIMERRARMVGYDGVQLTITSSSGDAPVANGLPSLADILGTETGEVEQRMARVLHDALPAVVDQPSNDGDQRG